MVGIVAVSHSSTLANGVAELVAMVAKEAPFAPAGGLENNTLGTSFDKISQAVESVYSEDGVIILMDIGSAVMTSEMVVEAMSDKKVKLVDAPLVEGSVAAASYSTLGYSMEEIISSLGEPDAYKKFYKSTYYGGWG